MKSILLIFCVTLGGMSCNQNNIPDGETFETDAVYATSSIQADGCLEHFSVAKQDSTIYFSAAEASDKLIEKVLGQVENFRSYKVRIKYRLTGQQQKIQCGWGHTLQSDEIYLLMMRKL